MKQPRTLDEARALYPDDAFYIVAAAGAVNLEIVTADGDMRDFEAPTEAEAWALAFPRSSKNPAIAAPRQRPPSPPSRLPSRQVQGKMPSSTFRRASLTCP